MRGAEKGEAAAEGPRKPYGRVRKPRGEAGGPEPWGGIGLYAESALHSALKEYLAREGDRFEQPVDGKVIDLVRGSGAKEELVEVQTKGLYKIAPKVLALSKAHKLRVVHPVAVETSILRLDPRTGELLSERKSPRRGDLYSVFDELMRATGLIGAKGVTVEVLLVRTRELRTRDGSGSWRRRGDRTLSRELVEVLSSRSFRTARQWLALIPPALEPPWSSKSLATALGIPPERARRILYSYEKAGLIAALGREGRLKLFGPRVPSGAKALCLGKHSRRSGS